jgi:hypothetical protein
MAATDCYLVDLFAAFLVPDRQVDPPIHRNHSRHRGDLDGLLLLVVGVRTAKPNKDILAAAAA